MRRVTAILAVAVLVVTAGRGRGGSSSGASATTPGGDDGSGGMAGGGDAGQQVGASLGGAQDANTFGNSVEAGYVPQPTDLTYEGLVHDCYFDTGNASCDARFRPSDSAAVSEDSIAGTTERFVTVGLDSGLTETDLERDPLNVVVVDTSGSMEESLSPYCEDGDQRKELEESQRKTEDVYDSLQVDGASGRLLEVRTLVPSRQEDNRTEGGVVLFEVDREDADGRLQGQASDETPNVAERTVTRATTAGQASTSPLGRTGRKSSVFTHLKGLKPVQSFDSDRERSGIGRALRARHRTTTHRMWMKR